DSTGLGPLMGHYGFSSHQLTLNSHFLCRAQQFNSNLTKHFCAHEAEDRRMMPASPVTGSRLEGNFMACPDQLQRAALDSIASLADNRSGYAYASLDLDCISGHLSRS